jgi:hypothetical protein
MPSTSLKPKEFFISWSGVPTLAYEGFSATLLSLKKKIDEQIPEIGKENPGSLWPKTTIGALHDGVKLSWDDVLTLREICDELNEQIKSENFVLEIAKLYLVIFLCRSLEKRLITEPINLQKKKSSNMDDCPPSNHLAQVASVLNQFAKSNLKEYLPKLQKDGNRESHYRTSHIESTLVFDLQDQQPKYIATFIDKVDKKLPSFYCWFRRESRHVTVRSLT